MRETPGVPSEPARAGAWISIFCTGLGASDPAVPSGHPGPTNEPLARVRVQPTVTIGGQQAPVSFAGIAPGLVGVYQVNAQLPAGVPAGDSIPLTIIQDGVQSNTVTIAVK